MSRGSIIQAPNSPPGSESPTARAGNIHHHFFIVPGLILSKDFSRTPHVFFYFLLRPTNGALFSMEAPENCLDFAID